MVSNSSLLDPVTGDHIVQFYDDDADLLPILAEYIGGGLAAGGAGIVIAGAQRLADVRAALVAAGADVLAAETDGRLVLAGADETLALFEAEGELDVAAFERVVGGLLREARAAGGDVRVYGEMVARLWDRGAVPAAIELERLWNALGAQCQFTLFCAYPARILSDPESADSFNEVCACHTGVVGGAPELDVDVARRFPAAPYAAPARSTIRAREPRAVGIRSDGRRRCACRCRADCQCRRLRAR